MHENRYVSGDRIRTDDVQLGLTRRYTSALTQPPGRSGLIGQIEQAWAAVFTGVVIWYSGTVDPLLPKLAESVFAQPAVATFKLASTSNNEAP